MALSALLSPVTITVAIAVAAIAVSIAVAVTTVTVAVAFDGKLSVVADSCHGGIDWAYLVRCRRYSPGPYCPCLSFPS